MISGLTAGGPRSRVRAEMKGKHGCGVSVCRPLEVRIIA